MIVWDNLVVIDRSSKSLLKSNKYLYWFFSDQFGVHAMVFGQSCGYRYIKPLLNSNKYSFWFFSDLFGVHAIVLGQSCGYRSIIVCN